MAKARSAKVQQRTIRCGDLDKHESHWWGIFFNIWCDGKGLGR